MHQQPFDGTTSFDQMLRAMQQETELDFDQLFFIGDQPVATDVFDDTWRFSVEAFTGVYVTPPEFRFLFPDGPGRPLPTLQWLLSLSIPEPAGAAASGEAPNEMDDLGRLLDAFMEAGSEDLPCIFSVFGRSQARLKTAMLMYPASLTAHQCLRRIQTEAERVRESIEINGEI